MVQCGQNLRGRGRQWAECALPVWAAKELVFYLRAEGSCRHVLSGEPNDQIHVVGHGFLKL